MNIAFFAPYSSLSPESNILYAVANYLTTAELAVTNVRCNGCLTTCSKDVEVNWVRDITSCQGCMHEQTQISAWGNFQLDELSPYVEPEIVLKVRELVHLCPEEQLPLFEYMGLPLFEIASGIFKKRFGSKEYSSKHSQHAAFLRRIYTAILRMHVAWDAYLFEKKPDIFLTTASNDFFVMSSLLAASQRDIEAFSFSFDEAEQLVIVSQVSTAKKVSVPLFFTDIYSVRPDVNTWPSELIDSIASVVDFIGVGELTDATSCAQLG